MILGSTNFDSYIQLFVVLVIFIFVLVLTYFTTRFIGGFQKNQMANKNLKIIDSIRVGNNKSICLIEVGEVYLVVGVGKDEVHEIAKLTKEELPNVISYDSNGNMRLTSGFQDILDKIKNKKG